MIHAATFTESIKWKNCPTVSMRGFSVSPFLIFQSVVNGTPDRTAKSCIWAWLTDSRRPRISAAVGIFDCMMGYCTEFGTVVQPFSAQTFKYRIR